jgi:hypothetical protein
MTIKREKTDYILFLIAFFITAMANAITISNITLILAAFITLYFFLKRGYKFDKAFIYFSVAYLAILGIYLIKFGYLDLRVGREYIKFLYGYILIKMIWRSLIPYFTKTVYILALISFPFYMLQLYDYEMAKSIVGILEHNIPLMDMREDWYENIFVFTLNDNGIFRNSGFAWEPKGFGTFLILAMFFRLMQNNFKLIDKQIIVYFIAAGTTLSTATFSIFFFTIIPFYLYNKKISYKIISSLILIPIITITFFQVEFLKDKIVNEYNTRDKYVGYINDKSYDGKSRSLGRFGSFLVDFMDLKKEPLLGYGNQKFERTLFSVDGVRLVRVSGLSDYMAKYGIVGIIFLLTTFSITFKQFGKLYKFKGWYWIMIGVLLISFSSAVLFSPIYLMLLFFPFINLKKRKKSTIVLGKK